MHFPRFLSEAGEGGRREGSARGSRQSRASPAPDCSWLARCHFGAPHMEGSRSWLNILLSQSWTLSRPTNDAACPGQTESTSSRVGQRRWWVWRAVCNLWSTMQTYLWKKVAGVWKAESLSGAQRRDWRRPETHWYPGKEPYTEGHSWPHNK